MWKCRTVESLEIQPQDFHPFPPSLEIAARFPHFHTHDDCSYNQSGNTEPTPKLLPMSSDKSVTYAPGRSLEVKELRGM